MKAVMREVVQARRQYSKLPLFEYLRNDAVALRDRLAFYPCMAPFVLALADLNRFVLRDESAGDPRQQLVNEYALASDGQWRLYLDDLTRLGFDRATSTAQVLRNQMREETSRSRLLGSRLAQLAHGATSTEKLVLVDSITAADAVLRGLTGAIAARIHAEGGPHLRFLARVEPGLDRGPLEDISLNALQRLRCLDLAFRVFDLFADWSLELLAYARRESRSLPRMVTGTCP
jgi:hypothetical protein